MSQSVAESKFVGRTYISPKKAIEVKHDRCKKSVFLSGMLDRYQFIYPKFRVIVILDGSSLVSFYIR